MTETQNPPFDGNAFKLTRRNTQGIRHQEGILMNDHLSPVERRLVEEIVKQHCQNYPSLADQLDHLRVVSREPTGVGAYINFSVIGAVEDETINAQLGFDGKIEIDGVPLGLGCVLLVDAGRLYHLELFTYGDDTWDGDLDKARIIPAKADEVEPDDQQALRPEQDRSEFDS